MLDAALGSFAQRGYEATSLDAVAAASGVRKQTILYHFASKGGLLGAVIERSVAELADTLGPASQRGPAAAVDAALRLGANRPELLELAREVVRLGPPASTTMFDALRPLLGPVDPGGQNRAVAMAAMVVALATEVEVLRAAGLTPDAAWLRRRRRTILAELTGS